jgi:predicted molibdopterin-dependent oxidoreductase YjgC
VVGLENPQVNDGWLCDRGQFGYDYVNSPDRLTAPMIRRAGGELEEVSWDEALAYIASRLKPIKDSAFGAIGSERISNEDNFALQQFTRKVMGSANIDHRMGSTRTGYAANRPSPGAVTALGNADVVLLIGTDLTADAPVLDLMLKRGLLTKKMKLIVANPRKTALNKFAAQWLQYAPGKELALLNALSKAVVEEGLISDAAKADAQGLAAAQQGLGKSLADLAKLAGVSEEAVREAARTFAGAALGSVVYGQDAVDARDGGYVLAGVNNLTLLAGQAGKPGQVTLEAVREMNSWGARDMGVLPDAGPGGAKVNRGLSTGEMLQAAADGRIKALYIAGSNPLVEFPGSEVAAKALENVELLIVSDLFLTETAANAHVVLPSVSLSERNCTITNVEGRTQRAVRAMNTRGGSKEDWAILNLLSEELGKPLGYTNVDSVVKAIRGSVTLPPAEAPKLQRVETPPAPGGDATYPLRLFTGKLMFDRSTIQSRSTVLPGLAPDPFAEINPAEAARVGIADGETVSVSTTYGSLRLTARVTTDVPAGSVFVPAGYNEAPVTALLSEGSYVAACQVTRIAGEQAAAAVEE